MRIKTNEMFIGGVDGGGRQEYFVSRGEEGKLLFSSDEDIMKYYLFLFCCWELEQTSLICLISGTMEIFWVHLGTLICRNVECDELFLESVIRKIRSAISTPTLVFAGRPN